MNFSHSFVFCYLLEFFLYINFQCFFYIYVAQEAKFFNKKNIYFTNINVLIKLPYLKILYL